MGLPAARAVLALFLLAIIRLPAAGQPATGELTELFAAAVRLQEAGQLEGAADAYRRFLDRQPDNVEALSNLGVVYAGLGRFDDAIAMYERALEQSYLNASIRMNLGLAYYKSGRCRAAVEEFARVLETSPGLPNAIMLQADCLMQLGEHHEAAERLRPLEPTHREERVFNYLYGMALLQANQTEAGLAQIDRILKDGDSAEARLMMGLSQRAVGDFAGAREEFRRAVEQNPALPLAQSLYGQMLLTTGDREGARQAFAKELASNPNDFESNLYTGVILKEEQRLDDARARFERALQVRPGDAGARYQLATVHLARGENEAALALLEPLVAEAPTFIEARVSLATVYYRLKRKAEGDRQREKVAELTAAAQARQPGAQPSAVPPQEQP